MCSPQDEKNAVELSKWHEVFWAELGIESDTGTPEEMRYHVKKMRERINQLEVENRNLRAVQTHRDKLVAAATELLRRDYSIAQAYMLEEIPDITEDDKAANAAYLALRAALKE
jgi:hypothetical protein